MEKLQQALQTARARRSDQLPPATAPGGRPSRTGGSGTSPDAAWEALPEAMLDPAHLARNRVLSGTADPGAVPFDILRTKVRLMMEKNGWKRLAITSPTPSCGKTTIACNLALGFSRQSEMRVIVFEFDLRRPNMDRLLGLQAGGDLQEMLAGTLPFAEQALRVQQTVAFSIANRALHDPGTLLSSQKTADRLAEIEAAYAPDLMIFDLPPLLVNEDARAFLRNMDCALMVAAAERSTVKELDICEREIAEQTNILGVVLNQCRHLDEHAGYGDYDYYG